MPTGVFAQEGGMNNGHWQKATFAGGCFWCMQPFFDRLKGVKKTVVGYTGGHTINPTYQQVSGGQTGHAEAIEITYDPAEVDYEKVLNVYWHNIDPTQANGQFVDQGSQYRTVIFYHDDGQKKTAEESKAALQSSGKFDGPLVVAIVPAGPFYPAEEYHQQYYKKSALRYNMYHAGTGREEYKHKVWGDIKE